MHARFLEQLNENLLFIAQTNQSSEPDTTEAIN